MFSRSAAQFHICLAIATAFLINACECSAQQQQSLFVIKAPTVNQSGYGQRPNAIRIASSAETQDESDRQKGLTPREDEGPSMKDNVQENLKDVKDDVKDMDLDIEGFEEDEDRMDDELDQDDLDFDDDDRPQDTPMTTWNLKPMSSITAGIRPPVGKSPADQSWQLTSRGTVPAANSDKLFAWAAPDIRYKPLYFEDVALERYAQTRGFIRQPFVSGLHFLKSAAFLPYYTLYDPVDACDGPLGYCRPGDCVKCVKQKHYFGNPFSRYRR